MLMQIQVKQTREYPMNIMYVLDMCSSHGTVENTQYCQGDAIIQRNSGGTHYSKIIP